MKVMNLSPIIRSSNVVMIFDVETNGLLNGRNIPKLEECPYILQLSYILYDLTHNRIVKTFDTYVKIPQNIEIPTITTSINGITKEKCNTDGCRMIDILQEFYGMKEGNLIGITSESTHYHANYVVPNWIHDIGMKRITQIGSHIFYKFR